MSLLAEKGTWTGGGSTPQTITLGDGTLTPVAIICWTSGPGTAGTISDDSIFSMGFGTRRSGATQSGCVGLFDDGGVATSDNARVRNTTLLDVLANSTTRDYTVSLDSFSVGQFVVSYSDAAAANGDVFHYKVLGGSDLTDAIVLNWTMDAVAGAEAITGAGFQPDVLFALDSDLATTGTITANAALAFGCASSNTRYRSLTTQETDGDTMTSTMNYDRILRTDACLTRLTTNADTQDAAWDLDSFDSDGASLGVVDAPANTDRIATFLFIKGGTWEVGHKAKITTTGNDTFTLANASLTPKGVFLFHVTHATADNLGVATFSFHLGGGTSTDGTKEGGSYVASNEAINTTSKRLTSTDRVIETISGTSSTEVDEGDLTQLNTGNFVVNWAVNGGTAYQLGYVAYGNTPAAPSGNPWYAYAQQ